MTSGEYILVAGGAGYIGSHTVVELIEEGYLPVVVDIHTNVPESIKRVEKITGKKVPYFNVDMMEVEKLDQVFEKFKFFAVMHLAGLKSVTQSISKPLEYYEINLGITLNLIECMQKHSVKKLVFSSSATVYGHPVKLPIDETHPTGDDLTNPYGKTKFFIEEILRDLAKAVKDWKICILRFFNPVGSHKSGLIGEDPLGPPNNLMPYVSQVAIGKLPHLNVYGKDYDTKDGTGVRDFIHITDVAKGHTAALKRMSSLNGCLAINLGTGVGTSVLEAVRAFEKVSCKKIALNYAPRRPGDIGSVYADPSYAEDFLGWKAKLTLEDMCADLWRWQTMNADGYGQKAEQKV